MTQQLDITPWVEAGEIVNTCVNQVHGWLQLAGVDRPIYLNLTGNMSTDLAGRRLTFRCPPLTKAACPNHLARQQIGPTGMMTRLDPMLILEWHSQDGHVYLQTRPSEFEASDRATDCTKEILSQNTLVAFSTPPTPSVSHPKEPGGLSHGVFSPMDSLQSVKTPRRLEDLEDQFALLDSILDADAAEVPIRTLLPDSLKTPEPGSLRGDRLQLKVKEVLAHLGLLGVTLDVCHHFTAEQTYRVLYELLGAERLHPQSAMSGYVLHYMTFEHCESCLADEETWLDLGQADVNGGGAEPASLRREGIFAGDGDGDDEESS